MPEAAGNGDIAKDLRIWTVGPAVLDERAMELRVNGAVVEVEPKALEALRFLVRRAGELVTKDDLMAGLWPGRIVTESSLAKCIGKLREALDDRDQTLIVTMHRYGYRLDAEVTSKVAIAAEPASAAEGPGARLPSAVRFGLAGVLAIVVAVVAYRLLPGPVQGQPSIAVLPFANLSAEPDTDYFSDGIHDAVIAHLARIRDLKTISRTSVMPFRDTERSVAEIGQMLNVAHIVEASVQRSGDRVRVTAQLIRTDDDTHLWAETYERDVADIFEIQSELARLVASRVRATLTETEAGNIDRRATGNPEAYDLFLRARALLWSDSWTPDLQYRVESLLNRAIEMDPEFALAHALLSQSHMNTYWWGMDPSPARRELARQSAEVALDLEPNLPEGRAALGQYHYHGFRDYPKAEREFLAALDAQPNEPLYHQFVGYIQRRRGDWESGLASLRRETELNPLGLQSLINLAETQLAMRHFQQGIATVDAAIRLHPEIYALRNGRAGTFMLWDGDLEPRREAVGTLPGGAGEGEEAWYSRWDLALREGRIEDAEKLFGEFPEDWYYLHGGSRAPLALRQAAFYKLVVGDDGRATEFARRANPILETEAASRPEDAQVLMAYAHSNALLGNAAAARIAANTALQLLSPAKDAVVGPILVQNHARMLLMLAEIDGALDELERIVWLPGAHGTVMDWKSDPHWQLLHEHPRFKAWVVEHRRRYPREDVL